jgi:hypothetical protein
MERGEHGCSISSSGSAGVIISRAHPSKTCPAGTVNYIKIPQFMNI